VRFWLAIGKLSGKEPYVTFAAQIAQAEAAFEVEALQTIMRASVLTPALALRYLRVRHPERFGH